ncbi:MAG: hypothetical protein ACK57G_07555, partial [Planctomycetota bacterium]
MPNHHPEVLLANQTGVRVDAYDSHHAKEILRHSRRMLLTSHQSSKRIQVMIRRSTTKQSSRQEAPVRECNADRVHGTLAKKVQYLLQVVIRLELRSIRQQVTELLALSAKLV